VGAELFYAGRTDGRTDTHDEANSRFFCNFANAPKNSRKFCTRTTLFTKTPPGLLWKHMRVSVVRNRCIPAELQHGGLLSDVTKIILVSMRYFLKRSTNMRLTPLYVRPHAITLTWMKWIWGSYL